MKRIISIFLLLCLLIAGLAGCNNPTSTDSTDTNTDIIAEDTSVPAETNETQAETESEKAEDTTEPVNSENAEETEKEETPVPSKDTIASENNDPIIQDVPPAIVTETEAPVELSSDGHIMTEMEQAIFDIVNRERAKEGLPAFIYNSYIYDCAAVRAREISINWSHTRPDGRRCFTVFNDMNKTVHGKTTENLSKYFTNAEQVVEGLMNSPGHRENLLDPVTKKCAFAIYEDEEGDLFLAQLFTE